VATTLLTATEFLYTGPNPIQTGVAQGTIDAKRVAVLRGKVLDRDGNPLSGATISVLNYPEFGQTSSRTDGMFDMVVNGGGLLTIRYQKSGYLEAQRQLTVPWQDFTWSPDVVLVQLDPQVATINLTSPLPIQVAQGSVVTDTDGTRQATLLVTQGTAAQMVMPDGSTQPLTSLSIRATEYTVGPNGPKAMPAVLPPTTGYTYCVELSADEALSAGAANVTFDRPLYFYVEDFIGFPVGSAVPAGYYDRNQGKWVASKNGRVIRILSITGGTADIDTNGDGNADDQATLLALGFTDVERQHLAALYPQTPKQLWRVPMTHFTPYDCNWPYGPPNGAGPPGQPRGRRRGGGEDEEDPCADGGRCIIEFQGQVLGESLPVVGTPFTLNYRSNRVPGFSDSYTLDIPLSGDTVPEPLKRIDLIVEVAGQRHPASDASVFPPDPNQSYAFTWDGQDAYGRRLQGDQQATIQVGYVYDAVYLPPAELEEAFGRFSGETVSIEGSPSREEVTIWQTSREMVGAWDAKGVGIGGWTLSIHHAYNPADGTLHLGTGETRRGQAIGSVITTYAGGGSVRLSDYVVPPEGIPATDTYMRPNRVIPGPDGTLYIAISHRIFRVDPEGVLTLFAGAPGNPGFSGDGGPATEARFNGINGIDLAQDGSLYVCDDMNNRIRRIGPDGIITTVAGNGEAGVAGDGGPAIEAQLYGPYDVAVAPDGGFYITQYYFYPRIRHVGPDGIITTIAGGVPSGTLNEGGLATGASVMAYALAPGPDRALYFTDYTHRIRRITPDGIVTTVAGTGSSGFSGDGGPATEAAIRLSGPAGLDVGPDGSIYFVQYPNRIRKITPDGIITTIAGNGNTGYDQSDEGSLPVLVGMIYPREVAVAPDGSLFEAEDYRVRRIAPPPPGATAGDLLVSSKDGRQVYRFDAMGRHLGTVDALTGALEYAFGYDTRGFLHTITDASGNVTTVERDGSGNPTAIVAPRGQRTVLTVNADGYLASLITPLPASWNLSYQPGGLLSSVTDPNGWTNTFTYNGSGRLIRDDDPEGGHLTITRDIFPRGFEVTATTAQGRTSAYRVEALTDGSRDRTVTFANGSRNTMHSSPDGTSVMTAPDGTVSTLSQGPDPRFGMLTPLITSYTETTPGGLTLSYSQAREVTLDQNRDLLHPVSVQTTQTLNGQVFTSLFSAAERTVTRTTPEGRQVVTFLDEQGRPVAYTVPPLEPVRLVYDSLGRLAEVRQGSGAEERIYRLAYDVLGFLAQVTDPLGRITRYTVDAAGRLTAIIAPDGRQTVLTYDVRGNLVSVTPPGGATHSLAYNRVHRLIAHDPPDAPGSSAPSSFGYNLDRQLTSFTRPDGRSAALTYDTGGRLGTATLGRGSLTYEYDVGSSRLVRVLYPGGEVSFSYDGSLITQMRWAGTVAGLVDRTYDNFFRAASCSVNGGNTVAFTYDGDGLLSAMGDLSITRNAVTGLVTGTNLGTVADTWGYNGFGELVSYTSAAGGEAWGLSYTRDLLGRVTQIQETWGSASETFVYTYDAGGRLVEVTRNGTLIAACEYDANGNRVGYTGPDEVRISVTYDAQDRLVSFGSVNYSYRADGSLQSRTEGSDTTTYNYDELGNLVSVILPGGDRIDYVIDGRNRRVGKQLNGTMVKAFLYKDLLHPVAELDGSGALVSRFVYGTRNDVPDYMVRGGNAYRILCDHLGSPRFVVDAATGAVAQRLVYDAFGNVLEDTSPGFQPFGFAGGLYDPDTGLVRFGARDYDPGVGRWTAPDPALFVGGSANLYAYVGNDPMNSTDPTGLRDDDCDHRQRDCSGERDRQYRSEARDLEWRQRMSIQIPYWLDSMIGYLGAVASTASEMVGAAVVSVAGSALGLIAYPVAFESAMQSGDRVAEILVDERVERDTERLEEYSREIFREERGQGCP
jgi:RHS repeat-associated protein